MCKLACVTTQGIPPSINAAHGLQCYMEGEFLRSKPEVLQKIRASLKEKCAQLRQVYEQHVLANESMKCQEITSKCGTSCRRWRVSVSE